jgi:hypothetical protein
MQTPSFLKMYTASCPVSGNGDNFAPNLLWPWENVFLRKFEI